MRTTPVLIVLLLGALGLAAAGWGWGWREHGEFAQADFTRRRLAFLDAENKRLGDLLDAKQRAADLAETAAQRTEIEHAVSRLRGLPFLRQVNYRGIPRSQLPELLQQKLAQQAPDKEFGEAQIGLSAMGLLPPGLDLKKTYMALLGEQIGAFYDQHSQELFTFSGQPLSNSQNRVILAHELTHALEDQHFNLLHLPLEAKNNDDRVMAASALVEGDATLVMNQYMIGNMSAAVIKDALSTTLTTDVRQLASAPRFLRETLLFPYLHGLEFCQTLYAEGGWGALAAAFARPPTSTAEILHPERFLQLNRQPPVVVEFAGTQMLGQNPADDNVMGEFGIRQLFSAWLKDDPEAAQAAEGWAGDRYLVFGSPTANSTVWLTCWQDEESARRFYATINRYIGNRYKALGPGEIGTEAGSYVFHGKLSPGRERHILLVALDPTRVALIDAPDMRCFDEMRKLLPKPTPVP